jgi:hypothetical protein
MLRNLNQSHHSIVNYGDGGLDRIMIDWIQIMIDRD